MKSKWEDVRQEAESLDHVTHEIGKAKEELRRLHWQKKRQEADLVDALVKADMHEYLKVDTKNLNVFLNEIF